MKKQPQLLQKVIRECAKTKTSEHMKEGMRGLLKGHDHLLEEFLRIFDDEKPPERCSYTPFIRLHPKVFHYFSASPDYEQAKLGASDEEVDEFENVIC